MLDFEDKLEKIIVDYFIKYNTNPAPSNDGKIVIFDQKNQIHCTNSIASKSNLNVAVSKNLVTKKQYDKALEIIITFQKTKVPFTWCIVSNSKKLNEKDFFIKNGFIHSETIITMVLDLTQFDQQDQQAEKEKFHSVDNLTDVENFRNVIKSAFSLVLIDLQKYYGLYELRKNQSLNYQVYLTIDGIPASTGQFYFQDDLVIIDDIATDPKFQKQGLGKKMLNHLLNTAKAMGYKKAVLIATPEGFPLYKKLGFKPVNFFIDVYQINY